MHDTLTTTIYDSLCMYAPQILVISLLSVITIFRREMSCNAVYGEEKVQTKPRSPSMDKRLESQSEWNKSKSKSCPLLELPNDVQIKCLSYLHPRDILTLSCVDSQMHEMIHAEIAPNSMSSLLWFHIFIRDYAWILTQWEHGVYAVNQSRGVEWNCPDKIASLLGNNGTRSGRLSNTTYTRIMQGKVKVPTMKEFYLMFSQTWLNYCIAGRTQNPTLVGIHGHVFDMTPFLEYHPGSPETIIMQGGGRDATSFFESVGHSRKARALALDRLVEVVDLACCGDDLMLMGLKTQTEDMIDILPRKRSKARIPATVLQLRLKIERERRQALAEVRKMVSLEMSYRGQMDMMGDINVYFDPLGFCWKAWYLNLDFDPIYVHDIRRRHAYTSPV